MSIEALAIVLNHSKATGAVKLILMGVANHINPDNDGAWPSQVKLASYANCTERYVRKALDELVELGELKFETHGGKSNGGNKSNRYWLTIQCPDDCDGSTNHRIGKPRTLAKNTPNSVPNTPNFVQNTQNSSSAEPLDKPLNKPFNKPLQQKRKSQIKEGWLPSDSVMTRIRDREWPLINAMDQIKLFVDYNLAKGNTYLDWDKAFTNWLNRASGWAKPAADERKIKGDF